MGLPISYLIFSVISCQDIRKNSNLTFSILFESAVQKLQISDDELKISQLSGLQSKRNNINAIMTTST